MPTIGTFVVAILLVVVVGNSIVPPYDIMPMPEISFTHLNVCVRVCVYMTM